jgi:hypothetical protein
MFLAATFLPRPIGPISQDYKLANNAMNQQYPVGTLITRSVHKYANSYAYSLEQTKPRAYRVYDVEF